MWKDSSDGAQLGGISLEGGDPIIPYLATDPLGCITLPPEGMGVPPVRSGDVAFAQRDGVVQFGDYYEPRQITLQVLVQNDDCPGCSSAAEVPGGLVLNGTFPGRAYTPDSAGLQITGDLDVIVHMAMDDWTPSIGVAPVSQWLTASGAQRGWTTRLNTTGTLQLYWSPDGAVTLNAVSTVPVAAVDGEPLWVRYTIDIDNGAAGRTIRFYTSTDGVSWAQLGAAVTQAGVTSIFNSTADVIVGSYNDGGSEQMAGQVFSVQIRNGGVLVASPNFDQPQYTGAFVDEQGNLWTVVSPAYLQPFQAARMSARQKVARLCEEWSRNCPGATLVIFSDCHDPAATQTEKTYQGPYMVHGRPRVAEVTWLRSNRGMARVLLRFDADSAGLELPVNNDPTSLSPWSSGHTVDAQAGGDGGNMAQDYRLEDLTMTVNGATVQDTHLSAGAPDGGSYFQRIIISPNTTSPMVMALSGSGTAAIPVVAGTNYTVSWWARKSIPGGPATRVDWQWYDAAGAALSVNNGASNSPTADWQRFSQTNVAPALAAFAQPRLIWTGTALAGQTLDFAQAWMNVGLAPTAPETIEVVGNLCVFPTFTLTAPLTAPITVNYGPNEFTYNEDVPVNTVVVDTRWGRASEITVDTTQNLSDNYTSPLFPGLHDFSVTTGNPADTGEVRAEWSNQVISG